ncbi:MAG: STAS/SEC14 domain-containing protein [Desulfosarcinaceae bacterium]
MAIGFDEIQVEETDTAKIVTLKINQKLDKEDYENFVPLLETQMQASIPIRILFELHAFKGWTAGALWEETKFAAKHFSDIERIAVVGESRWKNGIKLFIKPFTAAKVRFFDMQALDQARQWIEEG